MEQHIICRHFINHYCSQGFELLPRASLLHPSIPMSFVMSAGLVQVEAVLDERKIDLSGNRCVLIQKCFRYFDMEQVGMDNRHLSLFDMAGAFVFGVDPEREIISTIWDFVINILKLKEENIWITYFAGGEIGAQHVSPDEKTLLAWQKLGVAQSHIVGLGAKDNFWIQGGANLEEDYPRKCGPNTEIFFDRGEHLRCSQSCLPGCSCGRFIEVANTLFVEFQIIDRLGFFEKTTRPFVETVIGLERMSFVLGNFESIFDLPKYRVLINCVDSFISCRNIPLDWIIKGRQIIVDHIFALYALVSDGAPPPGRDGRAHIMKLLIRKVITQQKILGINHPEFMECMLGKAVVLLGGNSQKASDTIKTLLNYYNSASKKFERTINKGMQELSSQLRQNKGRNLTGCEIVILEKEKGLPNDLIKAELFIRGHSFPDTEYRQSLAQWRETL